MINSEGSGMQADSIAISRAMPRIASGGDHGFDEDKENGENFFSHGKQGLGEGHRLANLERP